VNKRLRSLPIRGLAGQGFFNQSSEFQKAVNQRLAESSCAQVLTTFCL